MSQSVQQDNPKGRDPNPYVRNYDDTVPRTHTTHTTPVMTAPTAQPTPVSTPQKSDLFSCVANFFKSITFTCVPVEVRQGKECEERLRAFIK